MAIESVIATGAHGRYLIRPAESPDVLVGFHGYAESADTQMSRLDGIPGSDKWMLISIQGLHRFYQRRTNEVVASWMTRQDRELAIADNVAYVSRVLEQAVTAWASARSIVFAGFSQGVAMAFRAAAATQSSNCHVLAVGGDVPPELSPLDLGRLSSVLLCRGVEDPWYTGEAYERDVARLTDAGVRVDTALVPGAHEWSQEVTMRAQSYLNSLLVRA